MATPPSRIVLNIKHVDIPNHENLVPKEDYFDYFGVVNMYCMLLPISVYVDLDGLL